MNVNIKRLHPDAVVPRYSKPGDSGVDLVAVEDVIIAPGDTALVRTGLAFEVPEGYEMQVRPRSGVSMRTKLRVQLGTIDSGYRGEVAVIVDNIHEPDYDYADYVWYTVDGQCLTDVGEGPSVMRTYIIRKGDRIAQAVIAPVERATFVVVAELSETERGAGGFGHTGVNGE
ncbi:dUTP diphosphatase [Paenibacillus sp. SN-8-1]|uniref:dUTP diphosphatase n=1 Tax=Paenibacillus sp. SN-8-1 TaxID=3435409 RepID=UPI003D9A2B3D